MERASQSLEFQGSAFSVACSVIFVCVICALGVVAWLRSGRKRPIAALECLRVFIAAAIAVTIQQPEWKEVFLPSSKPGIAILADVSKSMQTRDVFPAADPSAEALSRASVVEHLGSQELWQPFRDRLDVMLDRFSGGNANDGTDINSALANAAERYPNLKAIILATDGDWNMGDSPARAATRLRMRGVPVIAIPIGAEARMPDLEIASFDVPTFAIAGKPLRIPFSLQSALPRDEIVTVELVSSTGEVLTKIVTIPAMGKVQDTIVWRPAAVGEIRLSLKIPQTGGETFLDNNNAEARLEIRKEQLRVLLVESLPRWEYRYLRNALERDPGVDVQCLLFHPDMQTPGSGPGYLAAMPADDELTKYDVVFLGDVGVEKGQLTQEQCTALFRLVRDQASGIVFMPGMRGYAGSLLQTSLADLLPIVWDESQPRGWGAANPGNFALSEAGTRSLLTKLEDTDEASAKVWQTLPGFYWHAPALRAKAGSEVLAVHGSETNAFGRVPLIVTKTYGAGKILFMGTDGAWRWRRGVEDKYHYRFWGQVVRWMAYQRGMSHGERIRLFYSPDRPQTNATLTLNANVISGSGEPMREGVVMASLTAPSGTISSVRLTPGEDSWGLFTGSFIPSEPGEYRVHLDSADAGASLDAVIAVQGASRERLGKPARPEVLREIAQITRGQLLAHTDTAALIQAVNTLTVVQPIERRVPLWAHPAWAGMIIFLMALFWGGRKAVGSF